MPWVLSGCWESSNLTNERISLKTHYGNSRTGNTSKRPKGKNCKADSAWNRRTPKWLPGVPQDRCWGPAAGAELHSGEAFALWCPAPRIFVEKGQVQRRIISWELARGLRVNLTREEL